MSTTMRPLTVPVVPEIAPQLVSFAPVRKSYVLHNARPKRVETMFGGNMMTLPAVHEFHPTKCETDADGDPIPGTYVVEDIYDFHPVLRTEVHTFDAERAVIHILGINRKPDGSASELTSQHARSGLSLLPRHPPKTLWQPTLAAGEHRAFLKSVEQAHYTIEAIDKANARRKADGFGPVSGGPEYDHARYLIDEYNKLAKRAADDVLAPHRQQQEAAAAEEEMEFQIFLKAKVQELVDKAAEGKKIDKIKLFQESMEDPDVRAFAQKQWRFRKRGHRDLGDNNKP